MLNKNYLESTNKCLKWIENNMLTYNNGYYGIYERIRIDKNMRTNWTRPDCNAELAKVLFLYKKTTKNNEYEKLYHNITGWLERVQDKDAFSAWYGSFPFYLYDGYVEDEKSGTIIYQNDNGKVLISLLDLYENTKDDKFLNMSIILADYWLAIQRNDGRFIRKDGKTNEFTKGSCFILWLATGFLLLYDKTGDKKYEQGAIKALSYVTANQLESGRFKTSYELEKCEDWRPVSSETVIGLYAYSIAYKITGLEEYLKVINMAGQYILQLQHESGGIVNCSTKDKDASLQNNEELCDIVYTQGYALNALIETYNSTGNRIYYESAIKLADFLIKIQCKNESPLWDGAWRGSFNVKTWEWDGRADQNNLIDEGGMYSVYTGWSCAPIMFGLLNLYCIEE